MDILSDALLAQQLQAQFNEELSQSSNSSPLNASEKTVVTSPRSLVDGKWELIDPCPDPRALFIEFNDQFFQSKLSGCEVKWSPRMTLCAGVCSYEGRGGLCSIRLSVPLLKLRPRKDLVETLLHEMIHAYLFVTENNRDRDGHGPEFQKHMKRINDATGTSISIYHSFHEEVDVYRQHWWRCDGPCQKRKPYFGFVKRAMNRAPSPRDTWWSQHESTCNGKYHKIKEPEGYGKKKGKKEKPEKEKPKPAGTDIRTLFGGKGFVLGDGKTKPVEGEPSATVTSNHNNSSSGQSSKVRSQQGYPAGDKSSATVTSNQNNPTSGQSSKINSEQVDDLDYTAFDDDLDGFDWSVFDEDDTANEDLGDGRSGKVTPKRKLSESSDEPLPTIFGDVYRNKKQKTQDANNQGLKKSSSQGIIAKPKSNVFKDRKNLPNGKVSTASGGKASQTNVKNKQVEKLFNKNKSSSSTSTTKKLSSSIFIDLSDDDEVSGNSRAGAMLNNRTPVTLTPDVSSTSKSAANIQQHNNASSSDRDKSISTSEPTVSCPVCGGIVLQSKINQHLDLCL